MDRNKKNIAIVAGGDSSEYEISIGTAKNILKALNSDKYNAHIVEIKKSEWKVWGEARRSPLESRRERVAASDVAAFVERNAPTISCSSRSLA